MTTIQALAVLSDMRKHYVRLSREAGEDPRLTTSVCERYDEAVRIITAVLRATVSPFQTRVLPWLLETFGIDASNDLTERGDRLLEEVFELLQSHGYDANRIATLRDYTYSRPLGEPQQETGGVMLTLAAYCLAAGIDMNAAGEAELARVWTMVDAIRRKQASKRDIHSPLPGALSDAECEA